MTKINVTYRGKDISILDVDSLLPVRADNPEGRRVTNEVRELALAYAKESNAAYGDANYEDWSTLLKRAQRTLTDATDERKTTDE